MYQNYPWRFIYLRTLEVNDLTIGAQTDVKPITRKEKDDSSVVTGNEEIFYIQKGSLKIMKENPTNKETINLGSDKLGHTGRNNMKLF